MKIFDPFHPDLLRGLNLIEASAGTGKTYSITTLVLRLLIERGLKLNQILAVTFTNAAAKEIRDRVRKRLLDAVCHLEDNSSDPVLIQLFQGVDTHVAMDRLKGALSEIDTAPIFTIHSFCQQMLEDYAFETGQTFGSELIPDKSELVYEVAEDYWRILLGEYSYETLMMCGVSLDGLRETAMKLSEPGVTLDVPNDLHDDKKLADLNKQWGKEWGELVNHPERLDDAEKILLSACDDGVLKNKAKKRENCTHWFAELRSYVTRCGTAGEKISLLGSGTEWLSRLTTKSLKNSTRAGKTAPAHPVFDALERIVGISHGIEEQSSFLKWTLLREFSSWLDSEVGRRKVAATVLFYDDLLVNLQKAVCSESGGVLSGLIRDRYPAVLIDEFQDTDSVQWKLFGTVYAKDQLDLERNTLLLIGDPKQSIYGFRNADIDVYLQAKVAAGDQVWSMDTNYRSEPGLISAINHWAEVVGEDQCFMLPGKIDYEPVKPRSDWSVDQMMHFPEEDGSLIFYEFNGDKLNADSARADAVRRVVKGARYVLEYNRYQDQKLTPGDLAVLVRTNRQAESIKEALDADGIPAVIVTKQSVFKSNEANVLYHLLSSILMPSDERLLRGLLLRDCFKYTAQNIDEFSRNTDAWEKWIDRLQSWNHLWYTEGITSLMVELESVLSIGEVLMSQQGLGERAVANYRHMTELFSKWELEHGGPPQSLIRWLEEKMNQAGGSEEDEVRLESDADRVQVVTVHASKGLEYPVVFCPFLWDSEPKSQDIYSYNGKRLYSPEKHYKNETKTLSQQEELRLMYVAITRARHQLWIICEKRSRSQNWPISHWKANPNPTDDILSHKEVTLISDDKVSTAGAYFGGVIPELVEQLNPLRRVIRKNWLIHSFSSLAGHGDASGLPDRDALSPHAPSLEVEPTGIFALPRGAVFGTQVHELFENIDFTSGSDERLAAVQHLRRLAGYDEQFEPDLLSMVNNTLDSVLLPEAFCLSEITTDRRLVELDFYFPVTEFVRQSLAEITGAPVRLGDAICSGFIKGFIDLVFEQDGRFWIVDYKTNYLGASVEDYSGDALSATMASSGYVLQYHLYTLALHRYLKLRLPDYDYETHIGGAFYLFVRGMGKEGGGVFFDKVSIETLQAMDQLFSGEV